LRKGETVCNRHREQEGTERERERTRRVREKGCEFTFAREGIQTKSLQ
jgi:hypothetical protein